MNNDIDGIIKLNCDWIQLFPHECGAAQTHSPTPIHIESFERRLIRFSLFSAHTQFRTVHYIQYENLSMYCVSINRHWLLIEWLFSPIRIDCVRSDTLRRNVHVSNWRVMIRSQPNGTFHTRTPLYFVIIQVHKCWLIKANKIRRSYEIQCQNYWANWILIWLMSFITPIHWPINQFNESMQFDDDDDISLILSSSFGVRVALMHFPAAN